MNELTIKWLKREIDNGSFYVKTKLGNILVDHYDIDLPNFNGFQSDVKEIIERVPSYEELKAIKDRVNCQKNRIACLEYDLNRCNRLLKQWEEINRHMMQCHGYINHSDFHPTIRETIEWVKEMENE